MIIYKTIRKILKKLIKGYMRDFYWLFHGKKYSLRTDYLNSRSILFVCKGNICRSPFAEIVLKKVVSKRNISLKGLSCGIRVPKPIGSPKDAKMVAPKFGVDLNNHTSKPITLEMALCYDLIAVMEAGQLNQIKKMFPSLSNRLVLLSLFESEPQRGFKRYNIEDPFGKGEDAFAYCFKRINNCIINLIEMMESR